jgi:hypothetical protein
VDKLSIKASRKVSSLILFLLVLVVPRKNRLQKARRGFFKKRLMKVGMIPTDALNGLRRQQRDGVVSFVSLESRVVSRLRFLFWFDKEHRVNDIRVIV